MNQDKPVPRAMGSKLRVPEGESMKRFKARWDKAMASDHPGHPLKPADNLPVIDFPVETANIVVTTHVTQILPGRAHTTHTFEWEGDPSKPVWIEHRILDREGIDRFPWPLRMIGRGLYQDAYLCARADGRNIGAYWHHRTRITRLKLACNFKVRTICILMVLGLAYVPEYELPDWSHVGKKNPLSRM